jgi:hypothetical protein
MPVSPLGIAAANDAEKEPPMIVVRNVFQAKFGRAGELAQAMVESMRQQAGAAGAPSAWRVLTDLSGPFDTVVLEVEGESLAEWERVRSEMFAQPDFQDNFARTAEMLISGRNELYTIEARG